VPDKLGFLLSEFAKKIRRYRSREMARTEVAVGLTDRDLAILEFVCEKGQVTFGEIAKELRITDVPKASASSISQRITALYSKHGLVDKRLNPQDQRQPIIALTEKGKTTMEKVWEVRTRCLSKVRESMELDKENAIMLERAFTRGIENFDKILNNGSNQVLLAP
jgi:DNA-binding MarR family transcriptional regulator